MLKSEEQAQEILVSLLYVEKRARRATKSSLGRFPLILFGGS